MPIDFLCLSRNYTNTPLEVREALRIPEVEIRDIIMELRDNYGLTDCVILCTCNRTELYLAGTSQEHLEPALTALGHLRGLPAWKREETEVYEGDAAVRHLFRISAGLESQVLGENQILGQLKTAYYMSSQASTNGCTVNELFHRAFRLGKMVRTETLLCAGNTSVGRMAVEHAARHNNIDGKGVLIVGAGEISELVFSALNNYRPASVMVANRTRRGIVKEVEAGGGTYLELNRLQEGLTKADLIISATASPDCVVNPSHFSESKSSKTIYDLALPRDVDPTVGKIEGITLYNIDDLQPHIEEVYSQRKAEVPKVEQMVDCACEDFSAWEKELSAIPSIRRLSRLMEETRAGSIEILAEKLEAEDYSRVDRESRKLTRRLLNVVIGELKRTARQASK